MIKRKRHQEDDDDEMSPSELARFQDLERKWKGGSNVTKTPRKGAGSLHYRLGDYKKSPFKDEAPSPVPGPGQFFCSFCTKLVDYSTATFGTRGQILQSTRPDGSDKYTPISHKVVACPDCANKVREHEIMGIKFGVKLGTTKG